MIELNDTNGASVITQWYAKRCLTEFSEHLYGAEFGVAYGGGIQGIGLNWRGRGTVWGFDTFEGHPVQLADQCEYSKAGGGASSTAATCMQNWYHRFGTDAIRYGHIRGELDKQGLDHVQLIKGLVTDQTEIPFIPKLHYALLDMDFPLSQWNGYNLIKHKMVKGGYLCLHDMVPKGHIHGCYERYQEMLAEGLFEIVLENASSLLAVLRKK
jgi:hypothetical protein